MELKHTTVTPPDSPPLKAFTRATVQHQFRKVSDLNETVLVTKNGNPEHVLVDYHDYQHMLSRIRKQKDTDLTVKTITAYLEAILGAQVEKHRKAKTRANYIELHRTVAFSKSQITGLSAKIKIAYDQAA